MALTPEEIEGRQFRSAPEGYDPVEVDKFLTEVAASYRYAVHHLLPGVGPTHEASAPDTFGRLAQEVTDILRAAERLAESMRAEAEADAASIRARADLETTEARQEAEREREQAKRVLVRAQEQADAILAEADEQARARVLDADQEASRRSEDLLARSRRHAEQILRAERAVIDRLIVVRAELDETITTLTGSERKPVLDLTSGEARVRVGDLPPDVPERSDEVIAGEEDADAPAVDESEGPESGEALRRTSAVDTDPFTEMVRAAVGRAAGRAAGPPPPAR